VQEEEVGGRVKEKGKVEKQKCRNYAGVEVLWKMDIEGEYT